MINIGLISDTHDFLDPLVFKYFAGVDEIWHAGDIGTARLADQLSAFKPLRAVYGNIDGAELRRMFKEELFFEVENLKVYMTHIGGYPGKYPERIKNRLKDLKPGLFICGHSHILKVMFDKQNQLIHMNPGAAGIHGFHLKKTLIRFKVDHGKIIEPQAIELGNRSGKSV